MFTHEPHPVNAVSVAREAADILTDRARCTELVDRLFRSARRVPMADAMAMIAIPGRPATVKVGVGRLTEYMIEGALAWAREILEDRFGPPPAPVVVDWDRTPFAPAARAEAAQEVRP